MVTVHGFKVQGSKVGFTANPPAKVRTADGYAGQVVNFQL